MAQAGLVQRFMGVGHVYALVNQAGDQGSGGLGVPRITEGLLRRLIPNVAASAAILVGEGLTLELVIRQHAEGRNDILLEVLVLVVAPNQDEVRIKGVQLLPQLAEALDHSIPQALGGGQAFVLPVLDPHRFRPVGRDLHFRGNFVVFPQSPLEGRFSILVRSDQRRGVGHAQT